MYWMSRKHRFVWGKGRWRWSQGQYLNQEKVLQLLGVQRSSFPCHPALPSDNCALLRRRHSIPRGWRVLIHCGSAWRGVGVCLGSIAEEINARIPCMCCFWQKTNVQSGWSSEMTNRQQQVPWSGIERKRRMSEEGQRRPEIHLRSFSTVNLTN